ncbi:MAG: exodeoxyribonuclease VII large subunit [Spirochaetota bacterium]|nr:exodeoxyribonuclease VII large subunit [Spirochaetota bacterium]
MKGLEKSALSVSAVAFFISGLIKDQLGPVLVKGEISNLQLRQHSAYIRFSLKDDKAKIDCLTHNSSNAAKLLSHLQDGDEVIIFAQPSYYTKYGQISFFTDEMMKLGEGVFHSTLEKLRQKLYEEGLFEESRKNPLPKYPEHIGVVTSADGAVLQDILRVAQDRYPFVQISIFPSIVQGTDAPQSLYDSLSLALKNNLDAIIIGRGGGSSEDLNAFNNEQLIRLVAQANTPIIAAVGHEVDTTLIDYVADFSAPTPTGAAMILLPDKNELLQELSQIKQQFSSGLNYLIKEKYLEINYLKNQLVTTYQKYIDTEKQALILLSLKLQENNVQRILNKGFAAITSTDSSLQSGNTITIKTKNKIIYATINSIEQIEE